MSDNFYNILGVNEKATKDEIKKAYRGLQMKYHPDKNPGSQESINMTQKINEAYEILGDEERREEYDHTRNNPNPFMRMNSHNMEMPMDDLFSMFFGMPGMPGMPGMGAFPNMNGKTRIHVFNGSPMGFQQALQKPTPIMKNISITIDQVLTGATIPVDIEKWVLEHGIKRFEPETIYVTVPQGIDDGEIIVLREKGNILNDNIKGDVKIFIKIQNDSQFKRSGLDLILDKHISLKESLCGFSFELKYLNGKSYTLNNNKGNIIPPEYKKVYPGMGLTREEHKGNLIIHFHVDFPESLSPEQIVKLGEVL